MSINKAVIYTRFSDRPDAKTSESCEYQRELCEKWCKEKGYEVVSCFEDKGISGKTTIQEREGLGKALSSLKQGYALVVYNWDRLARDRMVHVAIESFVIGKKESPEDELVRSIMQSLSGYQRQINALRTKSAMLAYQKNGRRMGSVHPYGMRQNLTDPKLMIKDKKEQEGIKRIIELREGGLGWRLIAKTLTQEGIKPRGKQWHFSTIKNIYIRENA